MRTRELNPSALVAGALFTILSVAYLIGAWTDIRLDGRWVFPLALVALGVLGLAGALRAQRRADADQHDQDSITGY